MTALPIEVDATAHAPLGMPVPQFLRDYWQKRPLLIRNAFPDFRTPLTPEDLAGLACEEAALSRLVQHDRARDAWTLRQGPFAEEEFPSLPRQDWTLLVQDVDKWDMDVAALLRHFSFLPRWRIDDVMVSFAAPGGSVGAHVDQYDVFLLQGLGRRRWQIDARPNPPTAFRADVELKLLREFTPSHDWVLEAGDMLYLPPGVPHHGVALDACLTFSVGMRAPSHAELLVDFAEYIAEQLPEERRYADADLAMPADSGEIDDAAIARVMGAMSWLRVADRGTSDTDDQDQKHELEHDGIGCSGEVSASSLGLESANRADQKHEFEHDGIGCSGEVSASSLGLESAKRADQKHEFEHDGIGCSGEVSASSLRTWFGRFITRYRSAGDIAAPPRPPSSAGIESKLDAGAMLVRHPFCRIAWSRQRAEAELYVDGEAYSLSIHGAQRLADPAPIDATAYAALDASARALLHDLCARGRYALSRVPRRRA